MSIYKVLKEFGDMKVDEIINIEVDQFDASAEEIANYIKDGVLEEVKQEEYDGPMGKYEITGVAEYTDEKGDVMGELEIGSIQELPVVIGNTFVEKGVAKVYDEHAVPTPTPSVSEPKKFYEGKLIISEFSRQLNDKNYHSIRLEDGTTQDLTDEQYTLIVVEA